MLLLFQAKVAELEGKLAALANANPTVLQAQIEKLTDSLNISEKQVCLAASVFDCKMIRACCACVR